MLKINVRAFVLVACAGLTGAIVAATIAGVSWLAFDLVKQINSPIVVFVSMMAARGSFSAGDRMLFRIRKQAKRKGQKAAHQIEIFAVWTAYFFAAVMTAVTFIAIVRTGARVISF